VTLILGIDPGSRITGYGLVAMEKNRSRHVASGCVTMGELPFDARLRAIFDADEVAIERVFMARNPDSALKLGQARGAAICAVVRATCPCTSTRRCRSSRRGRPRRADKTQVQHMIGVLLARRPTAGRRRRRAGGGASPTRHTRTLAARPAWRLPTHSRRGAR
jgi:crossover junction endodeoxyribonuclease RuvC